MSFARLAVYYLPPPGALADFGAEWLGWDVGSGRPVRQPDIPGIEAATATPRKYGFHGTLKPPFRLAQGASLEALAAAVGEMAAATEPAQAERLDLTRLGSFLALTPRGDTAGIGRVAATCVEALDRFRAPPEAAELERRRRAKLSARQEALLARWGYPYVMEEFRFHLTLTGRLEPGALDLWVAAARARLPDLAAPFVLDAVALVGEREDGRFEEIHRYALAG